MAQCREYRADGQPCKGTATGPEGYCWAHDPANADRRRAQASKAARTKPNRELREVKSLAAELTQKVLSGELEPQRAAVANQLTQTRIRAIEQQRKIRETEDLEERLQQLEASLPKSNGKPSRR